MKILILITVFCFKLNQCLNCNYIEDNLLKMAKRIEVTWQLDGGNMGQDDYEVVQAVPKFCTSLEPVLSLERLHLKRSKTVELGNELFKNYQLRQFFSSYNNIKVIYTHTFLNITVASIELQSNRIELIEEEAFKDLSNLRLLDLSENRIMFINSEMFANLSCLREFILAKNLLKMLSTHDLDFLRGNVMESVNLNDNLIEILGSKSMSNVTFNRLFLYNNSLSNIKQDVFQNSCICYINVLNNKLTEASKNYLTTICDLNVMEFSSELLIRENQINWLDVKIIVTLYFGIMMFISIVYYIYYKIYQ